MDRGWQRLLFIRIDVTASDTVNSRSHTAILHYFFDPLCGWCYAAGPLIEAARSMTGLRIGLHAGGMWSGENRQIISAQTRGFVLPHDRRIARMSGQPFGEGYTNGLLNETGVVLDSTPPTSAILAAEELGQRGLDLLKRIQRAHYVEGRHVSEELVLRELAADIGLDETVFAASFRQVSGDPTCRHIHDSRTNLATAGGHGFPTVMIERADGHAVLLDASAFYGNPQGWAAHLEEAVRASA